MDTYPASCHAGMCDTTRAMCIVQKHALWIGGVDWSEPLVTVERT